MSKQTILRISTSITICLAIWAILHFGLSEWLLADVVDIRRFLIDKLKPFGFKLLDPRIQDFVLQFPNFLVALVFTYLFYRKYSERLFVPPPAFIVIREKYDDWLDFRTSEVPLIGRHKEL